MSMTQSIQKSILSHPDRLVDTLLAVVFRPTLETGDVFGCLFHQPEMEYV